MKQAELSAARLDELVAGFSRSRIAVVGDFFLDKYLEVDPGVEEVSVETGKPAHQVVARRSGPGAAGTVVCNLQALGAGELHAVGFSGDDGEGFDLRAGLERLGCTISHLHATPERMTPTYLKPRNQGDATLAAEHSRYDTKNRTPTPVAISQLVMGSIDELLPELDALLVMDQAEEEDCGVVTRLVREALPEFAARHPKVVFWADSRRRIAEYCGVIIKPNQFEAVGQADPLPEDEVSLDVLQEAVDRLRVTTGAPIVATRGADGALVTDPEWTQVSGVRVDGDIDPTGAGDSASAGIALALCAGASLPEAVVVGNLVASITIQQIGTTGVARPEQLAARRRMWEEQLDVN
jgi:rfaE bifunctional protein kinase chain/domain